MVKLKKGDYNKTMENKVTNSYIIKDPKRKYYHVNFRLCYG